ncbi:MAG: VOC family protein [Bacillus sp. (in: firmicutes)]
MTGPLLTGMEGVFIPVKDPEQSAEWYRDKLGFVLQYLEAEAAVMNIAEESETVVCLVRVSGHQPMRFPDNSFGVGKYYNFLSSGIEEVHASLSGEHVEVTPIESEGTTKFFTFYDPDGNPLGVCQSE